MRRYLPLVLLALAPVPARAATPVPLCLSVPAAMPDAAALRGDGYLRVAPDGSATWLLPGVRDAAFSGPHAAWWAGLNNAGDPAHLCVDGLPVAAAQPTAYPRWAPGGAALAYGDSFRVRVWRATGSTDAGPGYAVAWSPTGDALAVGDLDGTLTVRTLTGTVTATLATDRWVSAVAWQGGRVVYAASSGDGETHEVVSVRPDGSGAVVLAADESPFAVTGSRVAVGGSALTLVNADGSAPASVAAAAWSLAFSPDGGTLAFAGSDGGTVSAGGGTPATVVAGPGVGTTGWAGGAPWFTRQLVDGRYAAVTGGRTLATTVDDRHRLTVVRRDADGSYVVGVWSPNPAPPLPIVG